MTAAQQAHALARDVGQLRPDWSDPERYFERRSEIERDMRRLARKLEERA